MPQPEPPTETGHTPRPLVNRSQVRKLVQAGLQRRGMDPKRFRINGSVFAATEGAVRDAVAKIVQYHPSGLKTVKGL